MGVPGCPLLAACTPSIERVRMVLIASCSIFFSAMIRGTAGTGLESWFSRRVHLLCKGDTNGLNEKHRQSEDALQVRRAFEESVPLA